MKDNELRGLILQKYYDRRREGWSQWQTDDFKDLPDTADFDAVDVFRACNHLSEHGLIKWQSIEDGQGQTIGGAGKISAFGVDVARAVANIRYIGPKSAYHCS
jgi:hypothetical protein